MRIKRGICFAHPVLSPENEDYLVGEVGIDLHAEEDISFGRLVLRGDLTLNQPMLEALIGSSVTAGIMVVCRDTYFDEIFPVGLGSFEIELPNGSVRGMVTVRAVLASRDRVILGHDEIDPWFDSQSLVVENGRVIAVTEECRFEVGYDKLAPLESIFRLRLRDDMEEGRIEVGVHSEAVEIHAGKDLFEAIALIRTRRKIKDLLIPAVYFPALIDVLDQIRSGDDYSSRRWFRVLTARLNAQGLSLEASGSFHAAQALMKNPLSRLVSAARGMDE